MIARCAHLHTNRRTNGSYQMYFLPALWSIIRLDTYHQAGHINLNWRVVCSLFWAVILPDSCLFDCFSPSVYLVSCLEVEYPGMQNTELNILHLCSKKFKRNVKMTNTTRQIIIAVNIFHKNCHTLAWLSVFHIITCNGNWREWSITFLITLGLLHLKGYRGGWQENFLTPPSFIIYFFVGPPPPSLFIFFWRSPPPYVFFP